MKLPKSTHPIASVTALIVSLFAVTLWASEPAHLEPVHPLEGDGYYINVHRQLVGNRSGDWVLVLGSFAPEFAVLLRSERVPGEAKTFRHVIEVATARKEISYREETPGGMLHLRYDRQVQVDRVSKEVSPSVTQALGLASVATLRDTRYAERPRIGLDGATYLISYDRRLGKTWSPHAGKPASLVSAWHALADYVTAKTPEDEAKAMTRFHAALREFDNAASPATSPPAR